MRLFHLTKTKNVKLILEDGFVGYPGIFFAGCIDDVVEVSMWHCRVEQEPWSVICLELSDLVGLTPDTDKRLKDSYTTVMHHVFINEFEILYIFKYFPDLFPNGYCNMEMPKIYDIMTKAFFHEVNKSITC